MVTVGQIWLSDLQDDLVQKRIEVDKLRRVEGALLDVVGSGCLSPEALVKAMEALDEVGDWRCSRGTCGHPDGFHDQEKGGVS